MPISYLCELNIYRLIKGIKLSNMNTNFIDYWPTNREGNIRSSLPNNISKLAKRLTLLSKELNFSLQLLFTTNIARFSKISHLIKFENYF